MPPSASGGHISNFPSRSWSPHLKGLKCSYYLLSKLSAQIRECASAARSAGTSLARFQIKPYRNMCHVPKLGIFGFDARRSCAWLLKVVLAHWQFRTLFCSLAVQNIAYVARFCIQAILSPGTHLNWHLLRPSESTAAMLAQSGLPKAPVLFGISVACIRERSSNTRRYKNRRLHGEHNNDLPWAQTSSPASSLITNELRTSSCSSKPIYNQRKRNIPCLSASHVWRVQ